MRSNGTLRLALPPGHVDAYCLVCRTDVAIPEGTLKCPNGEHDVEPTSLAHMPKPATAAASVIAIAPELQAAMDDGLLGQQSAPRPLAVAAPKAEKAPPEPVVLPDSAFGWYADTMRLRGDLLDEEIQLTERLKRVRSTRKRLDVVLGLFVAPQTEETAPDPALPIAVEVVTDPAPPSVEAPRWAIRTVARDEGMARIKGATKRWATDFDACTNCGTTDRNHGGKGRCTACYAYWKATGQERPLSLDSKEHTS